MKSIAAAKMLGHAKGAKHGNKEDQDLLVAQLGVLAATAGVRLIAPRLGMLAGPVGFVAVSVAASPRARKKVIQAARKGYTFAQPHLADALGKAKAAQKK